jgi:hypothetical protein
MAAGILSENEDVGDTDELVGRRLRVRVEYEKPDDPSDKRVVLKEFEALQVYPPAAPGGGLPGDDDLPGSQPVVRPAAEAAPAKPAQSQQKAPPKTSPRDPWGQDPQPDALWEDKGAAKAPAAPKAKPKAKPAAASPVQVYEVEEDDEAEEAEDGAAE